jgi:translation initiation factor 2 subunit 2
MVNNTHINPVVLPEGMDYAQMLARARSQLPEAVTNRERFEVIKVKGLVQGNKTILSNLSQIADQLRRPVEHLLKYLTKELAAKAELRQSYAVFNAKVPSSKINEKITEYVSVFVMCKQCARPDTTMSKTGSAWHIHCQACGAKYTAKGVI